MNSTENAKSRRDNEGAILILVIAILMGLSLIGLGLMNQSTVNGVEAATEVSKAQAFWTADAGIERTMALAHKIWHSGASELFPATQPRTWTGTTSCGTYTITITEAPTPHPGYVIESDGLSTGNDTRKLSINILQEPALMAGVFGDIDLGLQPNARIYSYHSSSNTAPTPATSTGEAIVGSNEEISMKTSVILDGIILAGQNEAGIPASTNGCEGKTIVNAGRMDPDPLGIRGGIYAGLLNTAKTVNNNSSVPAISANTWVVPNSATSRIESGTYFLTSAEIRGTVVTDTTNGMIEIYLSGPFKAWPGSTISASADAAKFRIYSDSDAEITIQPSGDFGGLIYAPYSDMVRIQPGNNFYGVIWADEIQLQPGGDVYIGRRPAGIQRIQGIQDKFRQLEATAMNDYQSTGNIYLNTEGGAMKTTIQSVMMAVTVAMAAALFTGCEDRSTGSNIEVTPRSSTLVGRGSVALTAMDTGTNTLVYPLTWSVNNPAIGNVIGTGGASAVYESNGKIGTQSITVSDDTGKEGVAVVEQT